MFGRDGFLTRQSLTSVVVNQNYYQNYQKLIRIGYPATAHQGADLDIGAPLLSEIEFSFLRVYAWHRKLS